MKYCFMKKIKKKIEEAVVRFKFYKMNTLLDSDKETIKVFSSKLGDAIHYKVIDNQILVCVINLDKNNLEQSFSRVISLLEKYAENLAKFGINLDENFSLDLYFKHQGYMDFTFSLDCLKTLKRSGMKALSISIDSQVSNTNEKSYVIKENIRHDYYKIIYSGNIKSTKKERIIEVWDKKFCAKYVNLTKWEDLPNDSLVLWVKEDLEHYDWDELFGDIFTMIIFLNQKKFHQFHDVEVKVIAYWCSSYSGELGIEFLEQVIKAEVDIGIEIDGVSENDRFFPITHWNDRI